MRRDVSSTALNYRLLNSSAAHGRRQFSGAPPGRPAPAFLIIGFCSSRRRNQVEGGSGTMLLEESQISTLVLRNTLACSFHSLTSVVVLGWVFFLFCFVCSCVLHMRLQVSKHITASAVKGGKRQSTTNQTRGCR